MSFDVTKSREPFPAMLTLLLAFLVGLSSAAIGSATGLLLGSLVFFLALATLRRQFDALQLRVGRTENALDVAETGIFEVDLASGRIYWSKYHELLFGFEEGAFDGTKETFRSRVHPEDRPGVVQKLTEARASGIPYAFECRVQWPDGSVHWVSARGRFLRDRKGRPVRGVGTVVGSTARKLTELALAEARDRAETANQAKTMFLANVSHELRTPLTAILGYSEILALKATTAANTAYVAARITRNGRHLHRIIEDLLDLSKIEAGKLPIGIERLALPAFLADTIALLHDRARDKGVELVIHRVDPAAGVVCTDPQRLRQILLNIIGNALKFSEHGRVTIDAQLTEGPDGGPLVAIAVEDTGIGIPPAAQAALFQPFAQVDGSLSRPHAGTGLGLYLSRQMAGLLGGDVVLSRSVSGLGSTFTITFDAAAPMPREAPDLWRRHVDPLAETPLSGMDILVVEDVADLRELMSTYLLDAGAKTVELASDGQEAIEFARRGRHDIVLMDMQLPGVNGYEATRLLRSGGYLTPIVALSAHAMREEQERSLAVGCVAHLAKPVERQALLRTILTNATH